MKVYRTTGSFTRRAFGTLNSLEAKMSDGYPTVGEAQLGVLAMIAVCPMTEGLGLVLQKARPASTQKRPGVPRDSHAPLGVHGTSIPRLWLVH